MSSIVEFLGSFSVRRLLYYFSTCTILNTNEDLENKSPVAPNSWLRFLIDSTITRLQELSSENGGLNGLNNLIKEYQFLVMNETELEAYEEQIEHENNNDDIDKNEEEQNLVENLIFTNRILFHDEDIVESEELKD